jgi:hypothetical protein
MRCWNLSVLFWIILPFGGAEAQFSDDFSDADLRSQPAWQGDTAHFRVENNRLRLLAPPAEGRSWLGLRHESLSEARWSLVVELKFNPSSANYADIWLMADGPPAGEAVNGYFIRIGDTRDDVRLYRRDGAQDRSVLLIDGPDGMTDFNTVQLRIEAARDAVGNWTLKSGNPAAGPPQELGRATDRRYRYGPWFALACHYTATRSDKFYFDDIDVRGTAIDDRDAPFIARVQAESRRKLKIGFSEPVSSGTLQAGKIRCGAHNAVAVHADADHDSIMVVEFALPFFRDNQAYALSMDGVCDHFGNCADIREHYFTFDGSRLPGYRDVVINEIMADPDPPVGLPNAEYVELFNPSEKSLHLGGWVLAGASTTPLPDYVLDPGGYVLLCSEAHMAFFTGPVLSWGRYGNLLNSGEWLHLTAADGTVIDSLLYATAWYGDAGKKNGGWSLEQINPHQVCSDAANWTASADTAGGTPGRQNSVYSPVASSEPPAVSAVRCPEPLRIEVAFSKSMDPASLPDLELSIPGAAIEFARFRSAGTLEVRCRTALTDGRNYVMTISGLRDCAGNRLERTERSFVPDFSPPVLLSAAALHAHTLRLVFSEAMDPETAGQPGNYRIDPLETAPAGVQFPADSILLLRFDRPLPASGQLSLICSGLSDRNGNPLAETATVFPAGWTAPPGFGELIITEIMADPDPPVGLPNYEYIELYNASGRVFRSDRIALQVGPRKRDIDYLEIEPGQYALLCPQKARAEFGRTAAAFALSSWYTLRNGGDTLALYGEQGELIFALAYGSDWYQSSQKQNGGWSLEMMDTGQPCRGRINWQASKNPSGGTPGRENSHQDRLPDLTGPQLTGAWADGDTALVVALHEMVRPDKIDPQHLEFDPPLAVSYARIREPLCTSLRVGFSERLQPGQRYSLRVRGLADCAGNPVDERYDRVFFYLPEPADSGDVVINEVLPEPRPGGVEFIELYNKSAKFIDLRHWKLRYLGSGATQSSYTLAAEAMILEPDGYLVFCADPAVLQGDYPGGDAAAYRRPQQMPLLLNDGASLALLDRQGKAIDSIRYTADSHHPLIRNRAGVSLERLSAGRPGTEAGNWTSAASITGFASPGRRNSAMESGAAGEEEVLVDPPVFAPGQPGPLSYTTIRYRFSRHGLVASVSVTDSRGRLVRKLASQEILPASGEIYWDGNSDRGERAGIGYYLLHFHVFHPDGSERLFRKKMALAADFN